MARIAVVFLSISFLSLLAFSYYFFNDIVQETEGGDAEGKLQERQTNTEEYAATEFSDDIFMANDKSEVSESNSNSEGQELISDNIHILEGNDDTDIIESTANTTSDHTRINTNSDTLDTEIHVLDAPALENIQLSSLSNPAITQVAANSKEDTIGTGDTRAFALFIVLDDAGNSIQEVEKIKGFPGSVSIAIIPHLADSRAIAQFLYKRNISYIIHLPMEPLGNADPGPYAVRTDLSNEELAARISQNLTHFDNYLGFNNHMGSKAVTDPRVVDMILGKLDRKMIVLDSRTSADSILGIKSEEYGMIGLNRDVFIDNYDDLSYIKEQIRKGVAIAKKNHGAILIGHVTKTHTIDAIKSMYKEVTEQNGKFLGLQDYHGFMSSFQ